MNCNLKKILTSLCFYDTIQIVEQSFNYYGGEFMKQPICDCEVIHEETVNDVRKKMSAAEEYQGISSLFKLFGDYTRIRILHALQLHEMCVCDLAALLGLTKSAISHQLKELRLSNLVKFRREGQVVYYSLADEHVKKIMDMGMAHIRE